MKNYETVFIVRQDATPGQVETLAQTYAEVIRAHGGEVGKTEFCGLRNLAYKIKKNKKAHYVLMNLSATSAGVTEMERQLKLSEDVLRYLTVTTETLDNNPSPLMQQRGFREERHRSYDDDYGDRDVFDVPPLVPLDEPIVDA
ncbi:MAG: 30S ribosomal protein S6 [Alphaproteobacteria bacterium]